MDKEVLTSSESFFARVIITGSVVYGYDKIASSQEDGELCLKFTHNITEATKYETVNEAKNDLIYDPSIKALAILEELDNGQMRMWKITEKEKIREFYKNIHIIEVEAIVKVKNLIRG